MTKSKEVALKLKLGLWKWGRKCDRQREQKMQKPQGRRKATMSVGGVIRNNNG